LHRFDTDHVCDRQTDRQTDAQAMAKTREAYSAIVRNNGRLKTN